MSELRRLNSRTVAIVLSIALVIVVFNALTTGAYTIRFGEVFTVLFQGPAETSDANSISHAVFWNVRLPRVALAIVVGIAFLMTLVGLSPALGTFLAGVVLADSEFRHELESDIAPFKGLLLGLFFITVGAGMNFGTLMAEPALVIGMVIALVGLKAGVLYALGVTFKLKPRDRVLFTLSLAQAGEFGFVLVSFAVAQYILPKHLAEVVLLVIALFLLWHANMAQARGWLSCIVVMSSRISAPVA